MSVNSAEKYEYLDHFREDIFRMIPPDGLVIGSIGCGSACTEERLVKEGRTVHGVDVSEKIFEIARKRLSSMRVIEHDNFSPFENESLDGLILADVIEHIPKAWIALKMYSKAVKKGGWIVISVPNMRFYEVWMSFFFFGDWKEAPMGIYDETHVQVMSHKRLNRWAESAGLRLEKNFDFYHYSFFKRNVLRLVDKATLGVFRAFLNFEVQIRYRKA
jgi:2-polyprenyl-3-methyl-5-hydroxy-6-metoxy-1,4-benzoquinol methylase